MVFEAPVDELTVEVEGNSYHLDIPLLDPEGLLSPFVVSRCRREPFKRAVRCEMANGGFVPHSAR